MEGGLRKEDGLFLKIEGIEKRGRIRTLEKLW